MRTITASEILSRMDYLVLQDTEEILEEMGDRELDAVHITDTEIRADDQIAIIDELDLLPERVMDRFAVERAETVKCTNCTNSLILLLSDALKLAKQYVDRRWWGADLAGALWLMIISRLEEETDQYSTKILMLAKELIPPLGGVQRVVHCVVDVAEWEGGKRNPERREEAYSQVANALRKVALGVKMKDYENLGWINDWATSPPEAFRNCDHCRTSLQGPHPGTTEVICDTCKFYYFVDETKPLA